MDTETVMVTLMVLAVMSSVAALIASVVECIKQGKAGRGE